MTSHVVLAAGSRRAGRVAAGDDLFLDLARPVRRLAVAMTLGMLLVRRRLRVVYSSLREAQRSNRSVRYPSAACVLGLEAAGRPVSCAFALDDPTRRPERGLGSMLAPRLGGVRRVGPRGDWVSSGVTERL